MKVEGRMSYSKAIRAAAESRQKETSSWSKTKKSFKSKGGPLWEIIEEEEHVYIIV